MREIVSSELKFWKLALRESYYLELITEDQLIRMHTSEFYDSINSPIGSDRKAIDIVLSVMHDTVLFANLMKEEARILSKGILPTDKRTFKKIWISYLLDCLNDNYITDSQFDIYYHSIEFDGFEWDDHECKAAQDVIEMIRFMLVHQNPKIVEYIENPSFDLLMYVNDLEYI